MRTLSTASNRNSVAFRNALLVGLDRTETARMCDGGLRLIERGENIRRQ